MAVGTDSRTRRSRSPLTVLTLLCRSLPPKTRDTRTILDSVDGGQCRELDSTGLFATTAPAPAAAAGPSALVHPVPSSSLVRLPLIISLLSYPPLMITPGNNTDHQIILAIQN
jgi:hypothetical protein